MAEVSVEEGVLAGSNEAAEVGVGIPEVAPVTLSATVSAEAAAVPTVQLHTVPQATQT